MVPVHMPQNVPSLTTTVDYHLCMEGTQHNFQGVFFRKYTKKKAVELGIRGWCKNTEEKTVTGQLEGPRQELSHMKEWLQRTGSPSSRIDRVEFKNEKEIKDYSFKSFSVRH